MFMIVLEAHIPSEKWDALRQSFAVIGTRYLPSSVHETFLIHSTTDSTLWQVIVLWHQRAGFEEMKQQGTLPGVLLFRAVGAEPILSTWDVEDRGSETTAKLTR
jgi:hypothetical protein